LGGVAGTDDPVRRRIGRIGQRHLHRGADPRPLHHERQRVQVRTEGEPPGVTRERLGGSDQRQRKVRVVDV